MTERQYEVGQQVWVRVVVVETYVEPIDADEARCVRIESIDPTWSVAAPRLGDIRTDADFKDPLDEAIVARAMHWRQWCITREFYVDETMPELQAFNSAIDAKIKSQRPKTAEEIIAGMWFDHSDDGADEGGIGWGFRLDEADARKIAAKLRSANLLNEDSGS